MPQHKSCEKRMRTNAAARARNRQDRARVRTLEKVVLQGAAKPAAKSDLCAAYKMIDQMVAKGVLHANTGARQKAKLARTVNRLSA